MSHDVIRFYKGLRLHEYGTIIAFYQHCAAAAAFLFYSTVRGGCVNVCNVACVAQLFCLDDSAAEKRREEEAFSLK